MISFHLKSKEEEESFYICTKSEDLHKIKEKLEQTGLKILNAELIYKPNKDTMVYIDDTEVSGRLQSLLEAIDDLEDVQKVFVNTEIK